MAIDCVLAGEPVQLFEIDARRKDGVLVPVASTCGRSGAAAARWSASRSSPATSPSSGWPRQRWPRASCGCGRASRWPTSAAGCGTWPPAPCSGRRSSTGSTVSTRPGSPAALEAHLALVHPYDREPVRPRSWRRRWRAPPVRDGVPDRPPNGEVRWLYARAEVALATSDYRVGGRAAGHLPGHHRAQAGPHPGRGHGRPALDRRLRRTAPAQPAGPGRGGHRRRDRRVGQTAVGRTGQR